MVLNSLAKFAYIQTHFTFDPPLEGVPTDELTKTTKQAASVNESKVQDCEHIDGIAKVLPKSFQQIDFENVTTDDCIGSLNSVNLNLSTNTIEIKAAVGAESNQGSVVEISKEVVDEFQEAKREIRKETLNESNCSTHASTNDDSNLDVSYEVFDGVANSKKYVKIDCEILDEKSECDDELDVSYVVENDGAYLRKFVKIEKDGDEKEGVTSISNVSDTLKHTYVQDAIPNHEEPVVQQPRSSASTERADVEVESILENGIVSDHQVRLVNSATRGTAYTVRDRVGSILDIQNRLENEIDHHESGGKPISYVQFGGDGIPKPGEILQLIRPRENKSGSENIPQSNVRPFENIKTKKRGRRRRGAASRDHGLVEESRDHDVDKQSRDHDVAGTLRNHYVTERSRDHKVAENITNKGEAFLTTGSDFETDT